METLPSFDSFSLWCLCCFRVTEYQKVEEKMTDRERRAGILNPARLTPGGREQAPKVHTVSLPRGEETLTCRSEACHSKAMRLISPFVAQL